MYVLVELHVSGTVPITVLIILAEGCMNVFQNWFYTIGFLRNS